jgi:hypothetical protein
MIASRKMVAMIALVFGMDTRGAIVARTTIIAFLMFVLCASDRQSQLCAGERTNACDAAAGSTDAGCADKPKCEPWVVEREAMFDSDYLSQLTKPLSIERGDFKMPISGGAYHWFHQSLIGNSGGYGIDGLRGTYFYYLNADPQYKLEGGRTLGGHVEMRFRDGDTFRSFVDEHVWPWEAYGYVKDDDWGTLKAGLVYKQFGRAWDGVFFGNAPYFDGAKLDADYGLSWESTREVNDCFKIDRTAQFFFHEDSSNGSFAGGDAESVAGYTEKNTGVFRIVPTWTHENGGVLALGLSGLIGQIDSTRADLTDETVSAYALDLTYTIGRWQAFIEGSQTFGTINPVRYVSGGPSNRISNLWTGLQYTQGPVTYRCSYSNSIDANPDATQNMILTGATVTLTKNVDLYLEWVHERVDGAELPGQDGYFFNSLEYVVNWHF